VTARISFANPPGIPAPAARYSLTAEVRDARRWLVLSGQVPLAADGSVPDSAEGQAALVAAHLRTALAHHGMAARHIVKLTTYLVGRTARAAWQAERDALIGDGPPPASTQLIVTGLADPRWLLEVELIAAD
jgi:enamine deaminase RidA (YjgF/YER057c/UK114 family)